MKRLIFIVLLCDFFTMAYSQQVYNLNDCMIYAIEKNHNIKKQEFTNNNYKQDKIETIAGMAPQVGANAGISASYGRSIDPQTNTYTTTGNLGNSYAASAQMPLFAGFQNINSLRVTNTMKHMGLEKLQEIKDEVSIAIMVAYFNVVYYSNSAEIAKEQLATSLTTLKQSEKMLELGLKSVADVAQIESQVASDELFLTQQTNLNQIAILTLKKEMNYPLNEEIAIETNLENGLTVLKEYNVIPNKEINIADVIDYALENNSKILASKYSLREKELNVYIAQGKYAPSIYANCGYSSNYYKMLNGQPDGYKATSFFDQLKDNRGYYFGATISIPIFNGLSRRTNVHRAKNNYKIAQQNNQQTQMQFSAEIAQTILEMKGYEKEFNQASKKVEASTLSHQASINKYTQGIISPIDLQITANQLLLAKSQQLNARLQYIIKAKLVSYYNGEPLIYNK